MGSRLHPSDPSEQDSYVPTQTRPSTRNPSSQRHSYEPGVLTHACGQWWRCDAHSSTSVHVRPSPLNTYPCNHSGVLFLLFLPRLNLSPKPMDAAHTSMNERKRGAFDVNPGRAHARCLRTRQRLYYFFRRHCVVLKFSGPDNDHPGGCCLVLRFQDQRMTK